MSGILFAVIAVGWAAYLLPMALKRHDDVAKSRPVEEFSDTMRVVRHRTAAAQPATPSATAPAPVTPEQGPVVELAETPAARQPTITLAAARRAARRRRRVLAFLLLTLVAVSVTSYLGYTPWLSTAIPATLVVVFLVVARLTVRAQQARRVAPVQQTVTAAPVQPLTAEETEPDLGGEDTVGISRDELADAIAAPVLDEGGLWDPLPVTLPTYVNKARARRTVRTIEITAATTGITSSGHDAADSALAREAEALQAEVEAEADIAEAPKAAGA